MKEELAVAVLKKKKKRLWTEQTRGEKPKSLVGEACNSSC